MNGLLIFLNIYMFSIIILMVYILSYALNKNSSAINKMIGVLTALILIYFLGYLIELNASTLALKYFWNYIQYLAIPFIPAVWLLIALMNRYDQNISKKMLIYVMIIPVLSLIIRFTNNLHELYYQDYFLITHYGLDFMQLVHGVGYFFQFAYVVIAIIFANFLYFSNYLKRQGILKKTAFKLFLVSFFPFIGNFFNVVLTPILPIDYAVLGSPISLVLLAFILRDDYFSSIKPLARNQIFLNSETGTIVFNQLFEIVDFNPKAQAILKHFDLKGSSLTDIKHYYPRFPVDDLALEATFESNKQTYQTKFSTVTSNTSETIGYVLRLTDITNTMEIIHTLKEREDRIKNLVYFDQLTNLYNRHFLENYLKELTPYMHPILFIFIDMNELKYVNDTMGHQKGDELLVNLASTILKMILNDSKAIRLGGDEFLIMCPKKDATYADRFISAFKNEVKAFDHLSVAMGYAVKDTEDHFNAVYKTAEDAMYQDKNAIKKISKS